MTPGRHRKAAPASLLAVVLLAVALLVVVIVATARASTQRGPSRVVVEAISLAAATYGHGAELWRKARCETGGTYDPRSRNPRAVATKYGPEHASGLFQFLPSTWRQTPYARFSIWSPFASALAAGWMHAHGRGGEWSCR
jgi:hypothetical protein